MHEENDPLHLSVLRISPLSMADRKNSMTDNLRTALWRARLNPEEVPQHRVV